MHANLFVWAADRDGRPFYIYEGSGCFFHDKMIALVLLVGEKVLNNRQ
jgi:hypothetical protein